MQGWAEDTNERVMMPHTEMCEGCDVTSGEEGHDVARVTVQSDAVMQTDQRRKRPLVTVRALKSFGLLEGSLG